MDFQHIATGERISRWAYQKLTYSEQQNYRPYNTAGYSGNPNFDDNQSAILYSDVPALEYDSGTGDDGHEES